MFLSLLQVVKAVSICQVINRRICHHHQHHCHQHPPLLTRHTMSIMPQSPTQVDLKVCADGDQVARAYIQHYA